MKAIDFVEKDSIVREIWSDADCILFIFAGAAAEFSLNKQVDWLYFTGKLPGDPLGRMFSTVAYAQRIVFSSAEEAHVAIRQINEIHRHVEAARGAKIPDWAYRDVLFMLINYSISSFQILKRKLTESEKKEVFDIFLKVGKRMNINDLPSTYTEWVQMHNNQLNTNLCYSSFSSDLFNQYQKNLGPLRYYLLKMVQTVLVPEKVHSLLGFGSKKLSSLLLRLYKWAKLLRLEKPMRNLLLPKAYKAAILNLDKKPVRKCPFTGRTAVRDKTYKLVAN